MENKLDGQTLIIQYFIDDIKQSAEETNKTLKNN